MDNKKVLSKLVKIASNQQAILNKLAQAVDAGNAGDTAMNDFVKYQFTSWAPAHDVAGRLTHNIERDIGTKNYNVSVTITVSDPAQKSVVEDPTNGFAAWLNKKFAAAPSVEKWKALAGCTATFNVSTN